MDYFIRKFNIVLIMNFLFFSTYLINSDGSSINVLLLMFEILLFCLYIHKKIVNYLEDLEYNSLVEYYSKM